MFEKISQMAEKAAVSAGRSRRGFLGRCLHIAGGLGLGMIPFLVASTADASHQRCIVPWNCKCHQPNYGCAQQCAGCPGEAICDNDCFVFCYQACSRL